MKEIGYCYSYLGHTTNKCESIGYEKIPGVLQGGFEGRVEFRCMKKNRKIGKRSNIATRVKSPKWCPLDEKG